jgi:hypothetical protein
VPLATIKKECSGMCKNPGCAKEAELLPTHREIQKPQEQGVSRDATTAVVDEQKRGIRLAMKAIYIVLRWSGSTPSLLM